MAALTLTEDTNLLNASFGTATYPAPTAPIKVALVTAVGTASAAGTEVVNAGGSSYARQNLTMSTSSNGSTVSNTAAINFSNMPDTSAAGGVKGVDIYDSAATPVRKWWGPLSATHTTALADTLSFAAGALTASIS